ncbi:hypothetical protein Tco_1316280 [Tanacetum coccineum]
MALGNILLDVEERDFEFEERRDYGMFDFLEWLDEEALWNSCEVKRMNEVRFILGGVQRLGLVGWVIEVEEVVEGQLSSRATVLLAFALEKRKESMTRSYKD